MKTNAWFFKIGDGGTLGFPYDYSYTELTKQHIDRRMLLGLKGYVEIVLYSGWSKKITAQELNQIRANLLANRIPPRIVFL